MGAEAALVEVVTGAGAVSSVPHPASAAPATERANRVVTLARRGMRTASIFVRSIPAHHYGYDVRMPKDRDQLTPAEPEDAEKLEQDRGQGTGGTGEDVLPGEKSAPGASSAD